jgi:hypothetical protein
MTAGGWNEKENFEEAPVIVYGDLETYTVSGVFGKQKVGIAISEMIVELPSTTYIHVGTCRVLHSRRVVL